MNTKSENFSQSQSTQSHTVKKFNTLKQIGPSKSLDMKTGTTRPIQDVFSLSYVLVSCDRASQHSKGGNDFLAQQLLCQCLEPNEPSVSPKQVSQGDCRRDMRNVQVNKCFDKLKQESTHPAALSSETAPYTCYKMTNSGCQSGFPLYCSV